MDIEVVADTDVTVMKLVTGTSTVTNLSLMLVVVLILRRVQVEIDVTVAENVMGMTVTIVSVLTVVETDTVVAVCVSVRFLISRVVDVLTDVVVKVNVRRFGTNVWVTVTREVTGYFRYFTLVTVDVAVAVDKDDEVTVMRLKMVRLSVTNRSVV